MYLIERKRRANGWNCYSAWIISSFCCYFCGLTSYKMAKTVKKFIQWRGIDFFNVRFFATDRIFECIIAKSHLHVNKTKPTTTTTTTLTTLKNIHLWNCIIIEIERNFVSHQNGIIAWPNYVKNHNNNLKKNLYLLVVGASKNYHGIRL